MKMYLIYFNVYKMTFFFFFTLTLLLKLLLRGMIVTELKANKIFSLLGNKVFMILIPSLIIV